MKKEKSGNRGCLFLIIGTLCVLAGILAYIFLTGRLTAALIEARYGHTAAYAVMTAQIPCIVIAFLLMDAVLILTYLPSADEYAKQHPSPIRGTVQKRSFMGTRKLSNIVCVVLLAGVLVCGAVSVNTYRVIGEDGITTHCFVDTASYRWEDVTAYRVDCDADKGLSVSFTMTDGKIFEILHGTASNTGAFGDTYDSTTAFAAHVAKRLDELGVPRNVSHLERAVKFYKNDYPELWPYVQALIGYEELRPWEGEVATTTAESTSAMGTTADPTGADSVPPLP